MQTYNKSIKSDNLQLIYKIIHTTYKKSIKTYNPLQEIYNPSLQVVYPPRMVAVKMMMMVVIMRVMMMITREVLIWMAQVILEQLKNGVSRRRVGLLSRGSKHMLCVKSHYVIYNLDIP